MATASTGPLIPRRRLGASFRELREARGETLQQTARALMFSPSKLSRIENGLAGEPHPRDVRDLIAHFGLDETEQAAQLEVVAAEGRVPGWWQVPPFQMPSRLDTLISYESAASSIEAYIPIGVPGLLQTRAYAAGTLERLAPDLSPEEITQQVDLRLLRQEALAGREPPPDMLFVVPETVLRRRVGTPQTMIEQHAALLEVYDNLAITLHVIPFDAGLYEAAEMSSFLIYHYDGAQDFDVAALDTGLAVDVFDSPRQVREHRRVLRDAVTHALSRTESRGFIEESRRLWEQEK